MNRKAFSLVELTAVLTVISIIIVGIVTAGNLKKAAELNSSISDINKLKSAILNFKAVYKYYPGDFGSAVATFGSNVTNGNENGWIEFANSSSVCESCSVMIDLVEAGMIPDQSYATTNIATSRYPLSGINGGYVTVLYSLNSSATLLSGYNYISKDSNLLQIGAIYSSDSTTTNALFTPEEAYKIDYKIDDGKPRGGIMTYRIFANVTDATCTNSSTSYYTASISVGCNLVYEID